MAKIFVSIYASPLTGQQISQYLDVYPDFEIVEITSRADVLRTAILKFSDQVLLMGVQPKSPELSGCADVVSMLKYVQAHHFATRSMVLAPNLEINCVKQSIEVGALGFLMLRPNLDGLMPAIRLVNAGKLALDPSIVQLLVQ